MITEQVRNAIRAKYHIPEDIEFNISEDIDDDSYGCCHYSSPYIRTTITWESVPHGRKRKATHYGFYTGTVWELVQELEQ